MSAERPVEPALVQRVEEVRDELLAEQRALEALPRERAQLQEQIARLELRRQELRGELEALRQEQPVKVPRLPEVLSAPFKVKVHRRLSRQLLNLLFVAACLPLMFVGREGLSAWPYVAWLWGIIAALGLTTILLPPRWRFEATSMKAVGVGEPRARLLYTEAYDIQVLVTPSQKRLGVGTVVLKRQTTGTLVLIRNVPEPERLAEWLRSKSRGTT